jgi:hypothetical protein
MGLLLRAQCSCGYSSGMLAWGSGMNPAASGRVPAICAQCQEIMSVADAGEPRCPVCLGSVQVIPLSTGQDLSSIRAEPPVACPRCGAPDLGFVMTGVWD